MSLEAACVKEKAEVCVKTEGEEDMSEEQEVEDLCGVSAAAASAGLYTDHVVKEDLVLGPELWHRPKPVLAEGVYPRKRPVNRSESSDNSEEQEVEDLCGVSAAAASAGLYTDHVVKEELVLGPELWHRPKPVLAQGCPNNMSLEAVCVKEEAEVCLKTEGGEEQEVEDLCGVSAAAASAGLYSDHVVKEELVLGPELWHRPKPVQAEGCPNNMSLEVVCVKEEAEVCVKTEGEQDMSEEQEVEDLCGVSAAAASAGLYTGHVVKEELVLGPELWHRPKPVQAEAGARLSGPGRACSVRLERALVAADTCRLGGRTYKLRPHRPEPPGHTARTSAHYQCHHCDKRFRNKSLLTKHVHTHLSLRVGSDLRRHQRTHGRRQQRTYNGEKTLQCSHCDYTCRRKSNLQKHKLKHTELKPFKCSDCDYKTIQKRNLRFHQMIHTGEKPFQCSYCDYKCRHIASLQRHKFKHTTEVKPFKCSDCNYKTGHKGNLQIHQMIHTGEKPFQCSDCDFKCSQKSKLRKHQFKHTGVKPFKCSDCNYKSSQKGSLKLHQMIHTGEKPFQCSDCDYKCSRKKYLKIHQLKHTGLKPFKCNDCNYKTGQKRNLQIHQMIHTGENPFQCSHCDYKCRQQSNLEKHQLKHTGVKPFQCDDCEYKCNKKTNLIAHQKIHTEAKPYKCYHCSFATQRKYSLQRHLRTKHLVIKP